MNKPIRLTDRQCRLALKDLKEFGYSNLTFAEVREAADYIADGKDVSENVIARILKSLIDDATGR